MLRVKSPSTLGKTSAQGKQAKNKWKKRPIAKSDILLFRPIDAKALIVLQSLGSPRRRVERERRRFWSTAEHPNK